MAAKPIVDGIEDDYPDQLIVLRLDVQDRVGKELGDVYGVPGTPTFIFFDAQGNEVWRTIGTISPEKVAESLR